MPEEGSDLQDRRKYVVKKLEIGQPQSDNKVVDGRGLHHNNRRRFFKRRTHMGGKG
jgi:hypothetical protein